MFVVRPGVDTSFFKITGKFSHIENSFSDNVNNLSKCNIQFRIFHLLYIAFVFYMHYFVVSTYMYILVY